MILQTVSFYHIKLIVGGDGTGVRELKILYTRTWVYDSFELPSKLHFFQYIYNKSGVTKKTKMYPLNKCALHIVWVSGMGNNKEGQVERDLV